MAGHEPKRDAYHAQDSLKTLRETAKANGFDFLFFDWDKLLGHTEETFVATYSPKGLGFYAAVQDRQWAAKGEMGWFGMLNDTETQLSWFTALFEKISALPDDTRLTVVDCHI